MSIIDDEQLRAPAAGPLMEQRGLAFSRLVAVMQRLLGEDGCPWDREQTFWTLRSFVIEEAHEVVDAIDRDDPAAIREELGDLAFQIAFLSELGRAAGWFGPDDVMDAICDKMIRRHPHVFGDVGASSREEVLARWERDKAKEREAKGEPRGLLSGIPVAMPALGRAVKVGEKASRVGYDWPDAAGPRAKIDEELAELDRAVAGGDLAEMERELGDLLFSIASWARRSGLDPEAALRGSLDRFTKRFGVAERMARDEGRDLSGLDAATLDLLWEKAKAELA